MLEIGSFRWTPANVAHVARHKVTVHGVEETRSNPCIIRPTRGGRYLLIGPTNARRMLTVVAEPLGDDEFFCITARPASRRERREWTARYGSNAS
jgi:uncharacterized DUF497 family protein